MAMKVPLFFFYVLNQWYTWKNQKEWQQPSDVSTENYENKIFVTVWR